MSKITTAAFQERDPLYKIGFLIGIMEARREIADRLAREIAADMLRETDLAPKEIAAIVGLSPRVVQNIKAKISR